ncbi:MAG: helix-turn-helix domain-containing protein [Chloroflexota bacterium]
MAQPVHDASLCPRYHHAIELIGRRWTGAILQMMRGGMVRFSDLATAIPGLSDRMLSERLKELEAEQLVERRVIPETPVRVEYRLTDRGVALGTVLDAVTAWAHDWLTDDGTPSADPSHPHAAPDRPAGPVRVGRRRLNRPVTHSA